MVSIPQAKQQQLRTRWGLEAGLTSFLSFRFVSITMVAHFCSQIILQKSFTVSCLGPGRRGWSESDRAGPASPRPVTLAFGPQDSCSPTTCPEEGGGGPIHSLQSPRTGVGAASLSGPASLSLIPGPPGAGKSSGAKLVHPVG